MEKKTEGTETESAVRTMRLQRGWSLFELAKRADLHPNTIAIAERAGDGHMTPRTRGRLAEAFGCAPWDLERWPSDPPESK
jgi:transcriptional regulator with XRE-family HTH domain